MPTLTDWAWATAMLVQAMRASVTGNCRMIALNHAGGQWRIDFYFAEDTPLDRRLAAEIDSDFTAYMEDIWDWVTPPAHADVEHIVIAGTGPLPLGNSENARIVFLRHELHYDR